jgi:4-alpha-glucanotransferase
MEKYKKELQKDIKFQYFLQFKFNEQWVKLRKYCHENNIKLIGDVPIYVALDSSDTWASPENFQLDKDGYPTAVAGVPPDAFTADGQLWGNPLYNWDKMKGDNFKWWIMRLKATSEKFDTIRIDHFRGLEAYYAVPYGDKTARNGKWIKGPDKDFIKALHEQLPNINFIAEDLGYLTQDVLDLRNYSGYPGMKLLQFAFDSREESDYLPYGYDKNTVCYLGTHDNDTVEGWQKSLNPEDRKLAERFLGLNPGENLRWPLIRTGFATVSNLFVGTIQDYIGIGSEGRINTPGVMNGKNWTWRALHGEYNDQLAEKIADLTVLYGRY